MSAGRIHYLKRVVWVAAEVQSLGGVVQTAVAEAERRGGTESVFAAGAAEVSKVLAVVVVKLFAEIKVAVVAVDLDAGGLGIVALVEDFGTAAVAVLD